MARIFKVIIRIKRRNKTSKLNLYNLLLFVYNQGMKKLFILIMLLFILLLNAYSQQSEFTFTNYFEIGSITQYKQQNKTLIGESAFFNNVEIDNILSKLNAKIQFIEYIKESDITILFCTSPLIYKSIKVKNKIINLQIAIAEEYTVVGWPMILGSF